MGRLDDWDPEHFDRQAAEYDDWWLGTGRLAGAERPGWSDEVRLLTEVIAGLEPAHTLDAGCGTGFLTRHLRGQVVGLDASAGMLKIAAARMPDARFVLGDAIPLALGDREFERVFSSLFLHHLRDDQRRAFVANARRVGGELVVVEDVRAADAPPEQWREHVLPDGSRRRTYRRCFTADELAGELGDGRILHAGRWFTVVTT